MAIIILLPPLIKFWVKSLAFYQPFKLEISINIRFFLLFNLNVIQILWYNCSCILSSDCDYVRRIVGLSTLRTVAWNRNMVNCPHPSFLINTKPLSERERERDANWEASPFFSFSFLSTSCANTGPRALPTDSRYNFKSQDKPNTRSFFPSSLTQNQGRQINISSFPQGWKILL